ncbi:MAG: nitrous oxide-stimulated promoter family protein [Anaerolineaceae bacterium]|nr:nitrous oxide-stimulated promoter family protein [Anaerolineaceae bacterium]
MNIYRRMVLEFGAFNQPLRKSMHPRLQREQKTIDLMIELYCHDQHKNQNGLCAECQGLKDYAHLRLEKCPYQEKKTTCANCPTHCYQKSMREKIRVVMHYAGPRMLKNHPGLTFLHLLDGLRKPIPLTMKRK